MRMRVHVRDTCTQYRYAHVPKCIGNLRFGLGLGIWLAGLCVDSGTVVACEKFTRGNFYGGNVLHPFYAFSAMPADTEKCKLRVQTRMDVTFGGAACIAEVNDSRVVTFPLLPLRRSRPCFLFFLYCIRITQKSCGYFNTFHKITTG